MFIISIKKSVVTTYLAVVFGIIAMSLITIAGKEYFNYALIFLILSGICDMFDGKIARMCKNRTKEEKEFGIQIDSLADTVNFVVLPVVIMLSLGMNSIIDILVYIIFIICGISRLAVFNCNANLDEPVKFYTGLPVTSTAIVYPLLGLIHRFVSNQVFEIMCITISFIVAILFISKIKIPKFKKWAYIILPIIGIIVSILLLVVKKCIMI